MGVFPKGEIKPNIPEATGPVRTCPLTPVEYLAKFQAAKVRPEKESTLRKRADLLLKYRDEFYKPIGDACGCPWWVPALIHNQESGSDVGVFKAVLHNGERIIGTGKKTSIVPKGKGPFDSFVTAGIDALDHDGAQRRRAWDIGSALEFFERYNGLGYRNRGFPSPYLWAMTDQYSVGHFVADGKFDPSAVSKNYGIAGVLKFLL